MARARRAKTGPQQPQGIWHTVRQVAAVVLFAVAAASLLYGAWLGLLMHLTKTMPAASIWRMLICAGLAAALYTISVRIEPLPPRRKRRGNRWINVEMPTVRQIWETAPGDFAESILAAIGMMATPAMLFIGFGHFAASGDFPDLMIATAVAAGAFALEGAFVNWRGRSMFDPPGQVRKAEPESKAATATQEMDVDSGVAGADEAAGTTK